MAYYHCLLFDVDGTLLDFNASEDAALRETLAHFELPETPEAIELYHSINNGLWAALERGEVRQEKLVLQRFQRLLEALGAAGDPAKINDYYLSQLAQRADVYEGAEDTLKELAEVATLAVVSNGVERVQTGRLERSGLGRYFDEIFISSRVGATKPSRKIFDHALRNLGVENKEKVLMIGDSLKADIGGGIGAGLATCWCNFQDAPAPAEITPTYTIYHIEELMKIVMEPEELENVGNPEKRHQV